MGFRATAPLEPTALSAAAIAAINTYEAHRGTVADLSAALQARNGSIAIVKEQAAVANVATLIADFTKLTMVRARDAAATTALCQIYVAEKAAKALTERLRTKARTALDQYRQKVFSAFEAAINTYLQRFNAGFRFGAVASVNTRAGSSARYHVLINNVEVGLTAEGGPSFMNMLSAGDRNTLALTFFFASLDQEP